MIMIAIKGSAGDNDGEEHTDQSFSLQNRHPLRYLGANLCTVVLPASEIPSGGELLVAIDDEDDGLDDSNDGASKRGGSQHKLGGLANLECRRWFSFICTKSLSANANPQLVNR